MQYKELGMRIYIKRILNHLKSLYKELNEFVRAGMQFKKREITPWWVRDGVTVCTMAVCLKLPGFDSPVVPW